jgi:hypothetical protein
LGYFIFEKQIVLVKKFLALNSPSRNEKKKYFFVLRLLPPVSLENNLVDGFSRGSDDKDDCGIIRLKDQFVREDELLPDLCILRFFLKNE